MNAYFFCLIVMVSSSTKTADESQPVVFFGNRDDFKNGNSLDSFLSRYFRAHFGEAGIEYLRQVSEIFMTDSGGRKVPSTVAGRLMDSRGTRSDQDVGFLRSLRSEISEIVSSFQRFDFMNGAGKKISLVSSDSRSAVETQIHFRVHRFIGMIDYMKSHDWNLDTEKIGFKENVDEITRKEMKILLTKFKLNFAGKQDKVPLRFFTDSLKMIGMISWPSTDITREAVFNFLNNIVTAARAVGQPRNSPIEDIRYFVLHTLMKNSMGSNGIATLQEDRLGFFSEFSSQLVFTGFSIPFTNLNGKCSAYSSIVHNFEVEYTKLVRTVAALVVSARQDYKTVIGSVGDGKDCLKLNGATGLLLHVRNINCFFENNFPKKSDAASSEGCQLFPPPAASSAKTAPVTKPQVCIDVEALTAGMTTALTPYASLIIEQ